MKKLVDRLNEDELKPFFTGLFPKEWARARGFFQGFLTLGFGVWDFRDFRVLVFRV